MKTSRDHIPPHKQRELDRVLEIIHEEFEDALKEGTAQFKKRGRILKIILFGSYAKGGWVDEPFTMKGYRSDFDLLIIVNDRRLCDFATYWYKTADRLVREKSIETPVSFIVHSRREVNTHLKEGQYFFSDIQKEGVILYQLVLQLDQSIAQLTIRTSPDPAAGLSLFEARLIALAKSHRLSSGTDGAPSDLRSLLLDLLGAYGLERVDLSGPSTRPDENLAPRIGLVIHELATNAAKYGAFSVSGGKVPSVGETSMARPNLPGWKPLGPLSFRLPKTVSAASSFPQRYLSGSERQTSSTRLRRCKPTCVSKTGHFLHTGRHWLTLHQLTPNSGGVSGNDVLPERLSAADWREPDEYVDRRCYPDAAVCRQLPDLPRRPARVMIGYHAFAECVRQGAADGRDDRAGHRRKDRRPALQSSRRSGSGRRGLRAFAGVQCWKARNHLRRAG
nr:HWE histidine kinase domain-containing protein [Rhizobium populisoli]